ncbi:DUF4328 domain-containing protein [Mangrovibacterium diazotrophicum]|uniref:DUF4328 domain-containing protein n=1 Tax=Mangrovibacterium diazotrophicum TaxID=1261403 RepID=A0A419WBS8_9BACT|nr:DUF4328 domain-containing protein [Mangrovibacterium diazotrophicum]RKD92864.1 hypothetical protein BC643_3241 [Mangrovibacterium diazotrophicum]
MLLKINSILLGLFGPQEIFVIIAILGVFLLGIIPFIFYLVTLQNTLYAVSTENRKMSPGSVWLLLIPVFNLVWHFIVVDRISESLRFEFAERNINSTESSPGRSIGLAFCILSCCAVIPIVNTLAAPAALVCWIIFWVKMHECKMKLQQPQTAANV